MHDTNGRPAKHLRTHCRVHMFVKQCKPKTGHLTGRNPSCSGSARPSASVMCLDAVRGRDRLTNGWRGLRPSRHGSAPEKGCGIHRIRGAHAVTAGTERANALFPFKKKSSCGVCGRDRSSRRQFNRITRRENRAGTTPPGEMTGHGKSGNSARVVRLSGPDRATTLRKVPLSRLRRAGIPTFPEQAEWRWPIDTWL